MFRAYYGAGTAQRAIPTTFGVLDECLAGRPQPVTGTKPARRAKVNQAINGALRRVLKCFSLCAVMKLELLLSSFLLIASQAVAGWQPIPPLLEANGGFACGVVDNKIVVIGGTNWKDGTKHWLDGIWVFDPTSQKWDAHGKLPHPLAYAAVAEWNGDLIIAGGTTGTQPQGSVAHGSFLETHPHRRTKR